MVNKSKVQVGDDDEQIESSQAVVPLANVGFQNAHELSDIRRTK